MATKENRTAGIRAPARRARARTHRLLLGAALLCVAMAFCLGAAGFAICLGLA